MCPSSEFQEKVDVLDLIINILKEHEENLGKIADKFESVTNNLYSVESRISSLNETLAQILLSRTTSPSTQAKPAALVEHKDWATFKERSRGASVVAFEVEEKVFTVSSLSDGIACRYSESLPELKFQVGDGERRYVIEKMSMESSDDLSPVFERKLRCGLEVVVKSSKFDLSDGGRVFRLTYEVDSVTARLWLSEELGVPEENIVEGKLSFTQV